MKKFSESHKNKQSREQLLKKINIDSRSDKSAQKDSQNTAGNQL